MKQFALDNRRHEMMEALYAKSGRAALPQGCLLYTSDAADE